MNRQIFVASLLVALSSVARADLDAYLAKDDGAFKWEKKGEKTWDGFTSYELHVVSQEWHGFKWEHRVVLVRPEKGDHKEFCTLYNSSGDGADSDIEAAGLYCKWSGTSFAMVYDNPMQPLWGKREDALVVHTWMEFVKSMKEDGKGDESWPLHFPMAKAVLKGMDALQAFAREANLGPLDSFLVTGGSKQGWTAWLVGASKDPRVKAIAPKVIDILNVKKQAYHMLERWGAASERIKDYSKAGMPQLFETKEGQRLLEIEDPYSYRERLTLPKLIIIGTNDDHWTLDALNLYWDGLEGPKWVLYVPNSGHNLEDQFRWGKTMAAFARAVASGKSLPELQWKYKDTDDGGLALTVSSNVAIQEVRRFTADSKTEREFNRSRWRFDRVELEDGRFRAEVSRPTDGCRAVFGEAVFKIDGLEFTLSTQLRILTAPKKKRWL
ncbi:MAG TPA: PhoPQ-activated protein PqaA family protein [Planctomycetota bacterium]|nr:PhoPQ-activated protein PqaA family protein [Planctomycetota bacterium]